MTKAKTTAILEHTDIELHHTHTRAVCKGTPCTIHRRTKHSMRSFPQNWRGDRRIMERICPHGFGHPDPDDWAFRVGRDSGVHGCDGCCS